VAIAALGLAGAVVDATRQRITGRGRLRAACIEADRSVRAGGDLLLSELNCTSCHQSESIAKKQRRSSTISARAFGPAIAKVPLDPHAEKPGTTMPHLFADDPDKEAKVKAVHFLATTGKLTQSRPDLKAVIRGRDLYAKSAASPATARATSMARRQVRCTVRRTARQFEG
jgi:hypothetical protein